ncbi:MAG TPA: retropepsin-like aspartic protease [Thermoanaerobaculia bacterium]
MKISLTAAALLIATTMSAREDVRCRTRVMFPPSQLTVTVPFERSHNGVFFKARVNKNPEPLWFGLDSGAARTLISEEAAKRLLLHGTESAKIRGVGAGVVPVKVAKDVSIFIDAVKIEGVEIRIANLAPLKPAWGRTIDGVIGYDLLCRAVVTIDYEKRTMTMTQPAVFHNDGGESLPLAISGGWSFVRGTIKVTGRPAVIDNFLVDSGSQDAVNHPIIRDSKGPLKPIKAAVGLGQPVPGVLGPNEWFQLGGYTIGSTYSACCAASEDASRQIGAEVLSRFRVTFDYPHHRLILERSTR